MSYKVKELNLLTVKTFKVPVIEKGGIQFLLLNEISRKWFVRAYNISKPYKAPEESDHRIKEVTVKRSVKCYFKGNYDISNFKP